MQEQSIAAFLRHVGAGDIDRTRAMLSAAPALVNTPGPHPYWGGHPQALHVSIETKRREMFDLLLATGADVNGDNARYEHCSPLMLSVIWEQPEMREALLKHNAVVGLAEALLFADDQRVQSLLASGTSALPDRRPNGGSWLALARTSYAIDRLLELGVSPHIADRWGTTPMQTMSRLGANGLPLVKHLIACGLEAAPEDYAHLGDQKTLASLAAKRPELLQDDDVLIGAVDFSHHDLVGWLISQGASANARASVRSQQCALHSAAWNGDLKMAKLLIAAGADIDARDLEHDNTPAGWAETALKVTNNPRCVDVLQYLSRLHL